MSEFYETFEENFKGLENLPLEKKEFKKSATLGVEKSNLLQGQTGQQKCGSTIIELSLEPKKVEEKIDLPSMIQRLTPE